MDGTNRLLLFSLRENRFALDLRDVAEVLEPPIIFPIPRAPRFFPGIMNFHGNLVTILDLAYFLTETPRSPDGKVLVLDSRLANLAVWTDTVEDIFSTDVVLEEEESGEPLVEKLLIMADGEVRLLSVEKLLVKLEEHLGSMY